MSRSIAKTPLASALACLLLSACGDWQPPVVSLRSQPLALTPHSWCRGILPAPATSPNLLFDAETSEIYGAPELGEPNSGFGPVHFGEGDGRGTQWIADDPLTPLNEELEAVCRQSTVARQESLVGNCDGQAVDLDPEIDVTVGCLTTRYVRSASCDQSGLVDDDADPSTPTIVPSSARVYRRGYTVGSVPGAPTDLRAFARPSDQNGKSVAWSDATVRARVNPRALAENGPNDQGFTLYGRYVSHNDHYFAQVRRKPQATTCDSGYVTCDASGQVQEVQAELRIGEKLCGGPTVTLGSINVYLVNSVWYDIELTVKGSELYAKVSWTSAGGFPYSKQVHVDLLSDEMMQRRRANGLLPDDLAVEDYPEPIPAGTTGLNIIGIAAYFDDWTAEPPGSTVCPDDSERTPLLVDDDVDGFGTGSSGLLCPSWGYSPVGGDCNDLRRAFRPGAPEPCGYADFDCDGLVTALDQCSSPAAPEQRVGETDGIALDDVLSAENRWRARVNGALVTNGLSYTNDPTSLRSDHETATITTDGAGGRFEIERSSISPAFSLCDETTPYLVPDDPSTPAFDGVPNIKYAPKLWVRVNGEARARDLSLYLGDATLANSYRLKFRSGQSEVWVTDGDWVAFSISLENVLFAPTGSPDPCNIRRAKLRVVDDATGPVVLSFDALSKVPYSSDFPRGVVSLTFDDGFLSTYQVARDCLSGLDAACVPPGQAATPLKATIYPIISSLGTTTPEDGLSFLSEVQLATLLSEQWEVGVHAFDQHLHSEGFTKVSAAEVTSDMMAARQWLFEKHGAGSGYDHFAYPKGEFHVNAPGEFTDAVDVARQNFTSARTINWQLRERPAPSDMHKLRVRYVTRTTTVQDILDAVDLGIRNAEWVILVFHDLVPTPGDVVANYDFLADDFRAVVQALRDPARDIPVRTVGEVVGMLPVAP